MAHAPAIYLDIETDWERRLTVVGFHSKQTGLVQLVGPDITTRRVNTELPRTGRLYTYNGHSFDLSEIRKQLGLDLRDRFESIDLRWVCQRHGICGGQKAIEEVIGVCRSTEGVDGRQAIVLWSRWRRGDRKALELLLRYNAEDLEGLEHIHGHLRSKGILHH